MARKRYEGNRCWLGLILLVSSFFARADETRTCPNGDVITIARGAERSYYNLEAKLVFLSNDASLATEDHEFKDHACNNLRHTRWLYYRHDGWYCAEVVQIDKAISYKIGDLICHDFKNPARGYFVHPSPPAGRP